MQVWSVLHAARWKCRNQKIAKKSKSWHHRTTLSGYTFATKARIDNRKKTLKRQYLPHMPTQYAELRPTSGWDPLASLGHPSKFQRVSRLGRVGVSQTLRRWTECTSYIRQDSRPPGAVPIAATTNPERATNRRRGWLITNHPLYESLMSLFLVRVYLQLM